ncbi:hypothetical protein Tco_0102833 [Tanacetum coccineum]
MHPSLSLLMSILLYKEENKGYFGWQLRLGILPLSPEVKTEHNQKHWSHLQLIPGKLVGSCAENKTGEVEKNMGYGWTSYLIMVGAGVSDAAATL